MVLTEDAWEKIVIRFPPSGFCLFCTEIDFLLLNHNHLSPDVAFKIHSGHSETVLNGSDICLHLPEIGCITW